MEFSEITIVVPKYYSFYGNSNISVIRSKYPKQPLIYILYFFTVYNSNVVVYKQVSGRSAACKTLYI